MNKLPGKQLKLLPLALAALSIASPASAADAAAGKTLYDGAGACATCHGATGAGDGAAAAALDPKPASFATAAFRLDADGDGKPGSDADLANVIRDGAAKYGGNVAMPGRPDLSDDQVNNLVAYIHSLKN